MTAGGLVIVDRGLEAIRKIKKSFIISAMAGVGLKNYIHYLIAIPL